MNERTMFLAVLEIDDTAERAAYLNHACAGDAVLRAQVEELLIAHEQSGTFMGRPAPDRLASDLAETPGGETRTGPAPADVELPIDFLTPSEKPDSLGRLGHYEVLEVVGRGGMGVVLRALDEKLHRVVAVKVLAPQLAAVATARRRFAREAQAQAAVSHDHVVTIHAVEDADHLPYLVMQYVAGVSLQDRIDKTGPLQLQEILRIGMQTAAGLAAAHAQGLVHRDIKPSNILLENGVERVKITDFGLARAAADADLTQTGQVAGTPAYMSPEQAHGEVVDVRTDLFSLGSVLYAMCTGRPPFRAGNSMAVLKRVCEEKPRPIRETNSEVPDWLCAIIAKLQAKNPAERYQSAAEVATVLGECLARVQHPSVLHVPTMKPTGTHPARRSRWVAAALVFLALVAGLGVTEAAGVTNARATVIRIFTPDGTLVVETDDPDVKITIEGNGDLVITGAGPQEVRLKPGSYRLQATKNGKMVKLDRDLVTISKGDRQIVRVRLEGAPVDGAKSIDWPVGEVRQHEWPDRKAYFACFSPDGKYYAATGVASEPGIPDTVRVWDFASGNVVLDVKGNNSAVFTPDSKRLIAPGPEKQIYVWDLTTHQEVAHFGEHPDWVGVVSLSADGKRLVTSCNDGVVRLWDVASGKEIDRLAGEGKIGQPYFTPDGKQVVILDHESATIRLWDPARRQETRRWQASDPTRWWGMAFTRDGREFMTVGKDAVYFWDMNSDKPTRVLRLAGTVFAAALSPDGSRLFYLVERDTTMRLLDLAENKEIATFATPDWGGRVPHGTMGISQNGRFAVAAAWDGVVYLWRLPDPPAAMK